MADFEKYKMFFIKNNGTDTYSTQKDKLKMFIDAKYTITNNIKDRIKCSEIYNKYVETKTTLDIRIFIKKMQEVGIEKIKSTGYNYFIGIIEKA